MIFSVLTSAADVQEFLRGLDAPPDAPLEGWEPFVVAVGQWPASSSSALEETLPPFVYGLYLRDKRKTALVFTRAYKIPSSSMLIRFLSIAYQHYRIHPEAVLDQCQDDQEGCDDKSGTRHQPRPYQNRLVCWVDPTVLLGSSSSSSSSSSSDLSSNLSTIRPSIPTLMEVFADCHRMQVLNEQRAPLREHLWTDLKGRLASVGSLQSASFGCCLTSTLLYDLREDLDIWEDSDDDQADNLSQRPVFDPNAHWKKNRRTLYMQKPQTARSGGRGGRGGGGRGGGRSGGRDRRQQRTWTPVPWYKSRYWSVRCAAAMASLGCVWLAVRGWSSIRDSFARIFQTAGDGPEVRLPRMGRKR